MNKQLITTTQIKYALLNYYRFKRKSICASECLFNDVMAVDNTGIISEIEIKISKNDLWKGEAKKSKHKYYKTGSHYQITCNPNKFYICVPTFLLDEAKKWVESINDKYGIIEYINLYKLYFIKKAKKLHNSINESMYNDIALRVCSENIGLMEKYVL